MRLLKAWGIESKGFFLSILDLEDKGIKYVALVYLLIVGSTWSYFHLLIHDCGLNAHKPLQQLEPIAF